MSEKKKKHQQVQQQIATTENINNHKNDNYSNNLSNKHRQQQQLTSLTARLQGLTATTTRSNFVGMYILIRRHVHFNSPTCTF